MVLWSSVLGIFLVFCGVRRNIASKIGQAKSFRWTDFSTQGVLEHLDASRVDDEDDVVDGHGRLRQIGGASPRGRVRAGRFGRAASRSPPRRR